MSLSAKEKLLIYGLPVSLGFLSMIPALSAIHNDTQQGSSVADPAPASPHVSVGTGKEQKSEWIVAPLPSYSPSQRAQITLIGQYIFKPEGQSPSTRKSVIAVSGLYTQEESYGFFGAYSGSLDDDAWRVMAAVGHMQINYDFYGVGLDAGGRDISIPVEQKTSFGVLQGLGRIAPDFYFGAMGVVSGIDATVNESVPEITLPHDEFKMDNVGIGPSFLLDTRNNQFFPTSGFYSQPKLLFYEKVWGSDQSYWTAEFDFNQYFSISDSETSILAYRLYSRFSGGDVPFYQMSQFGRRSDLRGYIDGKYRDKMMADFQLEYRQLLWEHWGFVVFGGFGEVAPRMNDFNFNDLLFSGGVGIRYKLGKENPVHIRLDWAYGKDGDAWYVAIGEAF